MCQIKESLPQYEITLRCRPGPPTAGSSGFASTPEGHLSMNTANATAGSNFEVGINVMLITPWDEDVARPQLPHVKQERLESRDSSTAITSSATAPLASDTATTASSTSTRATPGLTLQRTLHRLPPTLATMSTADILGEKFTKLKPSILSSPATHKKILTPAKTGVSLFEIQNLYIYIYSISHMLLKV